jgi:hypothetical protein
VSSEAAAPSAADELEAVHGRRSRTLGITAFVIAGVLLIAPDIATGLANTPAFINQASPFLFAIYGFQAIGLVASFVLGLIAAITNHGRGWGIAALSMSVAGNYLIWALVNQGVTTLYYLISGTPQWY